MQQGAAGSAAEGAGARGRGASKTSEKQVKFGVEEQQHRMIEAVAMLGEYEGIEDYAKKALMEKYEADQEKLKNALKGGTKAK